MLPPAENQKGNFEKIIHTHTKFANVEHVMDRQRQCIKAMCRIEFPLGSPLGTGFLLFSNIVLTCYHVINEIIEEPNIPDGLVFRFDYKTESDGKNLQGGTEYYLVKEKNWLVASSSAAELDYALLRIDCPFVAERPWLIQPYTLMKEEAITIIQHPKGEPLKTSSGSITDVTKQPRINYTANTLDGSSGAPCFNSEFILVALHRRGEAGYNEGVLFSAILEDLQKRNLSSKLGILRTTEKFVNEAVKQQQKALPNKKTQPSMIYETPTKPTPILPPDMKPGETFNLNDSTTLAHNHAQTARTAVQSIWNTFHEEEDVLTDDCQLASNEILQAREAVEKIPFDLAQTPMRNASVRYHLRAEQERFCNEANQVALLIQRFSQRTTIHLRIDIQNKLDVLLQYLGTIDSLISKFEQ